MIRKILGLWLLLFTWVSANPYKSLNQILGWKTLEYGFPSENDRQNAIDSGLYTENAGTPIDVGVEYRANGSARIFTTIPRFTGGIPYSLATVSDKLGPNGPVINAYPSYEWHNPNTTQCTGITSAFRVTIDECNQMWVIDSGRLAGVQICRPQLLTFDLNTDTLIQRFQFTEDVYTPNASLLIVPTVDIRDPPPNGRCQKAMVYISDVWNHGLVVYDSQRNATWRIENNLMYPDPDWAIQTIAGESFNLIDGIFSVNLTPRNRKGAVNPAERYLYFHAVASDKEVAVPLRIIDNQTIWQNNITAMPNAFKVIGNRGVQSAMEAMDSKGNLFSSTHDPLSLFAWNIYNNAFKLVADNPQQLQFASGMKAVRNPLGEEELWVSTCRYQKVAAGTLNLTEINFRVIACKIDDLLNDRKCSGPQTENIIKFYNSSLNEIQ